MVIPSSGETMQLLARYQVPPHIVRHSMMVRRVAVLLAYMLQETGQTLNLPAIDRASLLHDLCKMDSVNSGKDHALLGQEALAAEGFPFIGDIVGQHVRLRSLEMNEAMVVNYADKRVMHDQVVTLSRRFVDLMNRYGKDDNRRERILRHHQETIVVEEILSRYCNDLDSLCALNLIPCDETLYGG